MKYYFLLLLFSTFSFAQKIDANIILEQSENGYNVYAFNNEFCPVTIEVNFTLENLKNENPETLYYVVEAQAKKQFITSLTIETKNKKYGVSTKTRINFGNHLQQDYDKDFEYHLPTIKGEYFAVHQGYNGNFSHQNQKAIDFSMPIGTPIYASRGGVVVKVVKNNTKGCDKRSCLEYNNYIIIYHNDGTFAEYTHIKQNGTNLKPGDQVKTGEQIGFSGNTGFSTGPHLHLVIFLQRIGGERDSLPTKFLTNDGTTSELLIEKEKYVRNYD